MQSDLPCTSCQKEVFTSENSGGPPGTHCGCDQIRNMRDLRSFGYTHAPDVRSAGGPYALRRPDGTVVMEMGFSKEVERLLAA